MKLNAIIKLIKSDGWEEIKRKGTSHRQFKHPVKPGKVTVPDHGKNIDLPVGTHKSILKQADLE